MRKRLAVLLLVVSSCATSPKPVAEADDDLAPDGPAVKDEKSAEEICAGGAGDMCSALADHTFRRAQTDEQRKKALGYALKGCELKDGAGCSLAGWAYEWGKSGAADLPRALKTYEQGCEIKDARSCVKAATLLSFGPASFRDRSKAKIFATKACTEKDDDGCKLDAKLAAEPRGAASNDCGKKGAGELTKAEIGDVIKWHSPEVRDCFDRALQQTPSLAGRVEVSWVIDCSGAVTKPTVAETSLPANVNECVLGNVKTWKFPAPKGGGTATVSFPWVLKPSAKK